MSCTATVSVNFRCSSVQYAECLLCSIIVADTYYGGKLQTLTTIFRQLSITLHNNLNSDNKLSVDFEYPTSKKEKLCELITAILYLF
jgi:hypothetical protein